MRELQDREDVHFLVRTFYGKVRKDELLGPIFNRHIAEEEWPDHLEKLTDFWETNLFGISKFKGSPSSKHVNVDATSGHSIDQVHFGRWLNLWFETINEHFEGPLAVKAREAARKMAMGQFLTIWNNRPENRRKH
jgi:hemoglobin